MKIAVVGSGTMGLGIAQAFAQAKEGYEVIVCVVLRQRLRLQA